MNPPNMRPSLSAVLAGLALAATAPMSHAAQDVASDNRIAGLTQAAQFAPPSAAEPRRAGRGSPVTVYLEDASGNAFRLVHVQGIGWKYADGWKSPDNSAMSPLRKVSTSSADSARPAQGATPDGEPLTVFIDGPSGFTYVWDREGGWKFVGKIADKSP